MINLLIQFKNYLTKQNLSKNTIKNYLADIKKFLNWWQQNNRFNLQNVNEKIFKTFNQHLLKKYQQKLTSAKISPRIINRYLSSIRKFGEFAKAQNWLTENPAEKLKNITLEKSQILINSSEKILQEFKDELKKEQIKPATIKNYLTDVRHFLNWLKKH